jgi:hypothetical protein
MRERWCRERIWRFINDRRPEACGTVGWKPTMQVEWARHVRDCTSF